MGRAIKYFIIAIGGLIGLLILISVLIYWQPVQRFAIDKLTAYISKTTGYNVSVSKLNLDFPLSLVLSDVVALDQHKDTILVAGKINLDVAILPLFYQQVTIHSFNIQNTKFNFYNKEKTLRLKASADALLLKAKTIDLKRLEIDAQLLDVSKTNVFLEILKPLSTKDTTKTEVPEWKIKLKKLRLNQVSYSMVSLPDSIDLAASIARGNAVDLSLNLKKMYYGASKLEIERSDFAFNRRDIPPHAGFNGTHMNIKDINIQLESVYDIKGIVFGGTIKRLDCHDESGLAIVSAKGKVKSDIKGIAVSDIQLRTTESVLNLSAKLPWSAFKKQPEGIVDLNFNALIGKNDLLLFAGDQAEQYQFALPDDLLKIDASVTGDLSQKTKAQVTANLSKTLFLNITAELSGISDISTLKGYVKLTGDTHNLNYLLANQPKEVTSRFKIPQQLHINSDIIVNNGRFNANFSLTNGKGALLCDAQYDLNNQIYDFRLKSESLNLGHFLPADSLGIFIASMQLNGKGKDLYSKATQLSLDASIKRIDYNQHTYRDLNINGSLRDSKFQTNLVGKDSLLHIDLLLKGALSKKEYKASLSANVYHVSLSQLNLVQNPMGISFVSSLQMSYNDQKRFDIKGEFDNWLIFMPSDTVDLGDMHLVAFLEKDSTYMQVRAGDLVFDAKGTHGINSLNKHITELKKALHSQLLNDRLDVIDLEKELPGLYINLRAGDDNPLTRYLSQQDMGFKNLDFNFSLSGMNGINGKLEINKFYVDTASIDTIRLHLLQDAARLNLNMDVKNTSDNLTLLQLDFNAKGFITKNNIELLFTNRNPQNKLSFELGLRALFNINGLTVSFFPDKPLFGDVRWNLNENNFIRIKQLRNIHTNLELNNGAHTFLSLKTVSDTLSLTGNALNLNIKGVDLNLLTRSFPFIPQLAGILESNVNILLSDKGLNVNGKVGVDSLAYEDAAFGDFLLEGNLLANADKESQIKAKMSLNNKQCFQVDGEYNSKLNRIRKFNVDIDHLPLMLLNPFIPPKTVRIMGTLSGQLKLNGKIKQPDIDGYIQFNDALLDIAYADMLLKMESKKLQVVHNKILINQYAVYGCNNNPLYANGSVDISDWKNPTLSLTVKGSNVCLINTERNSNALIYGNGYADVNTTVTGLVTMLKIRGNLTLLGNSKLGYIMMNSPLSVKDRVGSVVTFISFKDSLKLARLETQSLKRVTGINMLLSLQIQQAVKITIDLTADGDSNLSFTGGGELAFGVNPQGMMRLNGQYTISNGSVTYKLPVILSKTFTIVKGSSLSWSGDLANPLFNVSAMEEVPTVVTQNGQNSRQVNFQVLIYLKNTLDKLAISFGMATPSDVTIQNQLSSMTPEELNSVAINMLITSTYSGPGTSAKGSNYDALNSFIQKEVNQALGGIFSSGKFMIGIDSYNSPYLQGGRTQTEYSFRFSQQLINDRFRLVIGGHILTGSTSTERINQTFLDNVTLEYLLDQSGSRYLKLYHNSNYHSLLEGDIIQTGVGFVIRKKLSNLKYLFKKRKVRTTEPTLKND